MSSLTKAEAVTRNADGTFNFTAEGVRTLLEDNAALLAENKALNESLLLEREATQALIDVAQDRARVLEQENATLKIQNTRVKVTGFAAGAIVGICIGLAF